MNAASDEAERWSGPERRRLRADVEVVTGVGLPRVGDDLPDPRVTTCPFTGRLGMWTALRERRPQPRPERLLLPSDPASCPFCRYADPDPRLLPEAVDLGGQRWYGVHNIFPPIDGPTGQADLAVATDHDPTLTHLHPGLVLDWATMIALQQRLAARRCDRWSMVSAATGRTAGASQHHPHGHVLTPAVVPPATIRRQRRFAEPGVLATLLADDLTVAAADGVRLVAPPVPLGPLDLLLVPEADQRFADVDAGDVATLIVRWIAGVHGLVDPEPDLPATVAPFDAKVVLHPELPDGTGRWWGELAVTDRHAPGVAAVPLVDVRYPPEVHAERFRGVADLPVASPSAGPSVASPSADPSAQPPDAPVPS